MAFCTNCGAQLPEGTKFCGNCGAKQEIRTPVQTAAAAPEPAVPVQEPPQEEAPCACAAAPVEQADAIPAQQSYTPPAQESYTAPVQQSYTAPTQESYTAPAQQSYTAPTQQSYTAPAQGSYTAAAQQSYTAPVQQSYTAPAQESYTPPAQQSYTAPVQGSYTPPTQESYTAAAQQSYTAPAQESYTPPTQQSYTAPTQQSAAPQNGAGARRAAQPVIVAPKPKKPLNRKLLFIIGGAVLAVILAVVLICALGGKGGGAAAADPNLGVYTASTAEMLGVEMDITDLFEEGVSIELKENGKCAMNVNGTKGSGKWTLEDGVFHIKGGGLDCDGTLESGVMTLENMLGMGVQMTFVKEGGFTPADPDSAAGSGSAAAAAPASALQQQWAGTWYGCMYVSEATGNFAGIPSDIYDAYMVVDVDADGKGTFAVYIAGSEKAFALANCEAKESGLYATDGTIAGGIEMYAYNWMFLPMPDYPDQYVMGDEIQDGDSSFNFSLFMKQWGGSWQKELDSGFAIVPPSIAVYNDAIANGELPPYGFAPAE